MIPDDNVAVELLKVYAKAQAVHIKAHNAYEQAREAYAKSLVARDVAWDAFDEADRKEADG